MKALSFVFIGLWLVGLVTIGPVLGLFLAAGITLTIVGIFQFYKAQKRKRFFGDNFEHLFVVGNLPGGENPVIRSEYLKHVFFANPKNVRKTKAKIESLLEKNNCKAFISGAIKVHIRYFQNGEFINETADEYTDRLNNDIAKARLEVHSLAAKKELYNSIKEERSSYLSN